MNIYQKIQLVKEQLAERQLKRTGENKFSGYKYYELGDFLPSIIELCNKNGLFTQITFTEDTGILNIIDTDNPIAGENGSQEFRVVSYTSPLKELELKGANKIQALGGTETYLRRYLYMNAFDIIEADMFDSEGFEKKKQKKAESGAVNELIEKCKKSFLDLSKIKTDMKASKEEKDHAIKVTEEVSRLMKMFGYATFGDISKKQEVKDVVALAELLGIEIKDELKGNKGKE